MSDKKGKRTGAATTQAAPAAPKKQPKKQAEKPARLTPAELGHHVPPTGDRRRRFRKD